MPKQTFTVELDDDTLRALAVLGAPGEVLARLAVAAAEGLRSPNQRRRDSTNRSLGIERSKADAGLAWMRASEDEATARVVKRARDGADRAMRTAFGDGAPRSSPTASSGASPAANLERARTLFANQRLDDDDALKAGRDQRRASHADLLATDRGVTDRDLVGERAQADSVLVDQREANESLVRATVRAQELTDHAEGARVQAEQDARDLRVVAEFREMFIGILGHDLRNPLGSIVTAAAMLLRRGHLTEQDARTASRILRSSERITHMINQLLDLTRARLGGGFPIDPVPSDMGEICRGVVEEFETGVELEVEGDVAGSWDAGRLAELVSNLTGNALQYATRGTTVRVRVRGDGPAVAVEVENRGEAIPDALLPFIFEPFRRARQNEKSVAGNLGLGLYIAQQIAASHGGTLEARSAGGVTTFTLRVPRSLT